MKKGFIAGLLMCAGAFSYGAQAHAQAITCSAEERAREPAACAELDKLSEEIGQWQQVLNEARAKKNTIQGDVSALNAQIKKAEAEIAQRNNVVGRLAGEISKKEAHISELEARLQRGRESLAKLMREKNASENRPLAVLMLSSASFSDFFADAEAADSVNRELQALFDELRGVREETEEEKQVLTQQRNRELDARYEAERKKQEVARAETEQKKLLAIASQNEAAYQKELQERQARAAAIRAALFELRDAEGIPFSLALEYATAASQKTGVRAAFILGILRQESNLGKNVGQCLLVDPETGAGKGKNTGRAFPNTMHPVRDVPVFLDLMKRLGRDPFNTPVSCPQSVGYGGAMGPSQFIPSTWKMYEGKLSAALGGAPDPWRPQYSIMATALFLADLGAGKGTPSAEREAAGRYYAGSNWATLGQSYATSVLKFADQEYQPNIDFLNSL